MMIALICRKLAPAIALLAVATVAMHLSAASASDMHSGRTVNTRTGGAARPAGWSAPDQDAALARASRTPAFVEDVLLEDLVLRQQRLRRIGISTRDIEFSYLCLESPFVNTFEDMYGPVRFMHSRHATILDGDCATCHHYRPANPTASETVACSCCHQRAFDPAHPARIGLKAAYHMQCLGCHDEAGTGPVGCVECHWKKVPDHEARVILPLSTTPTQVTQECLRCHEKAGQDMLASAHWLWRGPSRHTVEHQSSVGCGKGTTALNNY